MRRLAVVPATAVAVAILAGFAPPAAARTVTYAPPVGTPVVDRFRPPSTPYGPGNRGLTYAPPPGTTVIASAPGRVTFAGFVAGTLHVTVQHDDGVRTSYSFLRTVAVRAGQVVQQGMPVGTSTGAFHFGARIGDVYVDPAVLLDASPGRVHLLPDQEFREEGARHDGIALARIVGDTIARITSSAAAWARDVGGAARSLGAPAAKLVLAVEAVRVAATLAQSGVALGGGPLLDVLDRIAALGEVGGGFATVAAALATIVEAARRECTPRDVAPPRLPGRRIAVFVGGLGSSSARPLSRRVGARALGYADGDVHDFSYRGGRHPRRYRPKDTEVDLRVSARNLRDRLDQIARDHPGVTVDLIAHSQGGLVVREALWHEYDRADRRLPPIGHVVTLGTPHHGADAATALDRVAYGIPVKGRAVRQMSERSEFVRKLNRRPLRGGVAFTSIAASTDLVVPTPRSRLRDATNVVLDLGRGVHAHDELPSHPAARREIALAIAGRPPTCHDLLAQVGRAVVGTSVASTEDAVARLLPGS